MDISHQHYDRLIHLIYETIENVREWDEVFSALRQAVDCKVIHALAVDKQFGTMSFSTGANLPAEGELSYLQKYQFIDPRSQHWNSLPSMECFHDHEMFDDEYMAKSEFYQDFLIPYGAKYLTAIKVLESEELSFSIGCLRGSEQGPLSADSIQFIQKLLPHLHRAVKINASHFTYSTHALIGHALINKMKQAVMLVTVDGKVMLTNPAAQVMLANNSSLRIRDECLCLPEPAQTTFMQVCARIEQTVKNAQATPEDQQSYKVLKIEVPENSDDHVLMFYLPLVPQLTLGVFGMRPLVMLMFYDPAQVSLRHDDMLLSAAFGLSPAELKIAAMIAEGLTIAEIAAKLNKQVDTIRKQLQSIYQKTATNSQVEFMRLLQHMPVNKLCSR